MALLQEYRVMDTTRLNEAREIVGENFCSHRLEIVETGNTFHAKQHVAQGRLISLNYLSYGETVLIEPGELEHFYLLQIPMFGHADISNGGLKFKSNPTCAAILNPDRHTKMTWHAACEQLLVYIPREVLRQTAMQSLRRSFTEEIVFNPEVPLASTGLKKLRNSALMLARAADHGDLFNEVRSFNQILYEETFLIDLLKTQPSNISCFFSTVDNGAVSKYSKLARDFITENAAKPIGLIDISTAAGLPARTLQHQFKNTFGMSPIAMLKQERLNQIYHELNSGHCHDNLAQIAERWGFFHVGRFSQHYKAAFGELPSQTKSRAQNLRYTI